MKKQSTAPTMKDVAREAGVALGTVSKVFNGIPVGEAYKQKVEEAAQKLGYQVNSYARALKTNKTNSAALILPNLSHPFFAALANACVKSLQKRGYRTIIETTDFNPDIEIECLKLVNQNKVDGIICLSYNPRLEVDSSLPFVSIDRYFDTSIPCIASDNYYGGVLAAEKLKEFGCRKLLFLRTASNVRGEADKRQIGFEAACSSNQIPFKSFIVYDKDKDSDETDEREPIWQLLRESLHEGRFDYDGIFCGTDHLAYLTCKKLKELGLSVPEDVQIIGFDGISKFGGDDYYVSTIVQPVEDMAEAAVNILFDNNNNKIQPLICLPVSFAYGGTTKKTEE